MIIATTFKDGMVSDHFGRTEGFKIYEVENGKVKSTKVVDNQGLSHGNLVNILVENNVNVLICGTVGNGAINIMNSYNIECVPGTFGESDKVVLNYLSGNVTQRPNSIHECSHHDHDDEHEHHH